MAFVDLDSRNAPVCRRKLDLFRPYWNGFVSLMGQNLAKPTDAPGNDQDQA
jgi:hypothetical protein